MDELDEAISAVKFARGQTGNVHFVAAIMKAVARGELVRRTEIREAEARVAILARNAVLSAYYHDERTRTWRMKPSRPPSAKMRRRPNEPGR
jgi:predicted RNA-binding protein with PUA domain